MKKEENFFSGEQQLEVQGKGEEGTETSVTTTTTKMPIQSSKRDSSIQGPSKPRRLL